MNSVKLEIYNRSELVAHHPSSIPAPFSIASMRLVMMAMAAHILNEELEEYEFS